MGNLLRWALDHNNAVNLSDDEKDLIMSIVGPTVIVTQGTDADGNELPDFTAGRPGTIDFSHLVGDDALTAILLQPLKVLTCSDAECTTVTGIPRRPSCPSRPEPWARSPTFARTSSIAQRVIR